MVDIDLLLHSNLKTFFRKHCNSIYTDCFSWCRHLLRYKTGLLSFPRQVYSLHTAMAASICHLLLLLGPVLSLCGATEYYVRPNEPTNTSCPGQPCLTLSQYINDSVHYFQSNAVFQFLPGTHHIYRPLIIGNIHNLSLESYSNKHQPQLVVKFTCKNEVHVDTCLHINLNDYNHFEHLNACCATILLYNVSMFTVNKQLTISQQTSNVTGVFSERVVNNILVIELVGINPISEIINRSQNGIVIIDSYFIQMQSFIARNCWSGLLFTNSSNIQIHNATISDNYNIGMIAQNSCNIYLSSSHITNNTMSYGIYMHKGCNIIINNTSSMWNKAGIYFEGMNTTQIVNTISSNNTYAGIQLLRTVNINISNTTVSHNVKFGLLTFSSNYVHIDGIIATMNVAKPHTVGRFLNAWLNVCVSGKKGKLRV